MGTIDPRGMGRIGASLALAVFGWLFASGPALAHGSGTHPPAAAAGAGEQQAWGIAGARALARRTVEIRMGDDMRFRPSHLQVREGDTVRFVVHNDGKAMHEFVLGTPEALDEHARLMERFPGMEHDEPHMAHVPPGGRGEIVWHFNRAGEFRYACLIAGHYGAGMVGTLRVVPAQTRRKPDER